MTPEHYISWLGLVSLIKLVILNAVKNLIQANAKPSCIGVYAQSTRFFTTFRMTKGG